MKFLVLCFSVCFFWAQNATAFCYRQPVKVKVKTSIPKPKYHHNLTADRFPAQISTKKKHNKDMEMRGLTVSKLEVTGQASSYVKQNKTEVCVGLKEVTFEFKLNSLDVYIDKRYAKNSCAYREIKEHEDIHAGIFSQAVPFYKPDLEKALQRAVDSLVTHSLPISSANQEKVNKLTDQDFQKVIRDISPVLDHMNKKVMEKNEAIDTYESYMEISKKCPKW
jgi:hypothetical protein